MSTNEDTLNGPEGGSTKSGSSTRYPYFGIAKSIELVEAVRRAGGNDAACSDVMRELSVGKTDRTWSYGVPTAVLFGLVERIGRGDDGRIRVTELAKRIVLPGSPEEMRIAKIAAVRTPELYTRLLDKFAGHPPPSKEGLKNILHREFGIVESMAGFAADAFLESVKTCDLTSASGAIVPGDGSVDAAKAAAPAAAAETAPGKPGMKQIQVPEDFVVYRCKIGGGRVIEIPLPAKFTKRDVDRLYAFLQTQVDDDEASAG